MENILKVSMELGYMNIPEGVLVDLAQVKSLPKNKVVIISTGSQGEAMSALYRMAYSSHKQIEIQPNDRIIISASAIPGNENSVSRVIDELFYKGAEVIYNRLSDLHVSGHACQEEQKMMMALTQPKYFIPVHGEHRHLRIHAKLAQTMGISPKNIMISEIGKVIEINGKGIRFNGTVTAGKVLVDGSGVGDVGSVVLRDRKHLAEDGMIVVVVNISSEDGSIVSGPDIITRGFIYVKESEELMNELRDVVTQSIWSYAENGRMNNWTAIKGAIKGDLSNYLYKKTKRNPMILPVVTEV
jgi:ribonuclease J